MRPSKVLLTAVAAAILTMGQPVQASVTSITAVPSGDVNLEDQFFIPPGDLGAHFDLATLGVAETGLENPSPGAFGDSMVGS